MQQQHYYEPTDLLAYLFTSVGFKPDSSGGLEPEEDPRSEAHSGAEPRPYEPADTTAPRRRKKRVVFEDPPAYALNTSPICVFYRRNAGIVVCRVNSADPECEILKRNGKIMARVRWNPVVEVIHYNGSGVKL